MNYNAVNQMTSLTRSKGDDILLTQTNTYNGEGQRIRKLETSKKSKVLQVSDNGEESYVSNSEEVTINRDYYYQDGSVLYTTDGSSQNDFNVTGATGNIIASSKIAVQSI